MRFATSEKPILSGINQTTLRALQIRPAPCFTGPGFLNSVCGDLAGRLAATLNKLLKGRAG